MSKRDWKILFEDMVESIEKIEHYTDGISFDDFAVNSMVIDAVIRNIEVIGEASKNIPEAVKERYPYIPWQKLGGIRNRIVHEYFGVDISIIWFIVCNELFQLKQWLKEGLNYIVPDSEDDKKERNSQS